VTSINSSEIITYIFEYEPEMVVPPDLKYYPDSGRFLKFKPQKEKPTWLEVEEKTSFKNA
jgi:hypothetical protein